MFLSVTKSFYNVWIVGFSLGIAISYMLCCMTIVCTTVYEGKLESFAVNRQMLILFYVGYQWLVTKLNNAENMDSNMRN